MNQRTLLILICAIVFPIEKIGNVLFVLFLVSTLYFKFVKIKANTFRAPYNPLILLFFATLFLLKFRFSLENWDRDLSLIVLPICFSLLRLDKNKVIYILKYYVILLFVSILLSCIYEFVMQYYFLDFINLWKLSEHYNNSRVFYFFHSVSERMDFHHIYLTLYLFIGFTVGLYLLNGNLIQNKKQKLLLFIAIIFFFIFSVFSISRMSILCFIIFITIQIFLKNKPLNRLIIILFYLVVLGGFFYNFTSASNRFNNVSNDPRVFLFEKSLELSKKSIFIGYGYEKGSKLLQEEQLKANKRTIYNNSHNQYLDYLLGGGIIMLIVFIAVNGLLFNNFKRNNNYIAITIQLFFLLQLFSESLLYRYRGIVIYALFMSLFFNFKNEQYNDLKLNKAENDFS